MEMLEEGGCSVWREEKRREGWRVDSGEKIVEWMVENNNKGKECECVEEYTRMERNVLLLKVGMSRTCFAYMMRIWLC